MIFTKSNASRALRLGLYGPPGAGKTAASCLAKWDSFLRNLPSSGMEIAEGDSRSFNANRQKAEELVNLLSKRGLPSTEFLESQTIDLYDGPNLMLELSVVDPVGQVYSQTRPDSAEEDQRRFEDQLRVLGRAEMLWYLLPMPPRDGSPSDIHRFETNLKAGATSLREVLRVRSADCSLAIVLSKADLLWETPQQARQENADEDLLQAVQPLVSIARGSEKVLHAALFPISAMGFGKALPLAAAGTEAPTAGLLDGAEQEYILAPQNLPEPFNTLPLLVYSMAAGLLSIEVDEEHAQELKDLYTRLRDDLASLDGWIVPVKGEL